MKAGRQAAEAARQNDIPRWQCLFRNLDALTVYVMDLHGVSSRMVVPSSKANFNEASIIQSWSGDYDME
jgi:hypothetical protein